MTVSTKQNHFKRFSSVYFKVCASMLLVLFAYVMIAGGISMTDYGSEKYGNYERKAEGKGTLYVLTYTGAFTPGNSEMFAEKVDAILPMLNKQDKVLLNVESPGGVSNSCAHSYYYAKKIQQAGVKIIGVTDYLAASCGYMLLSVSDYIAVGPGADIGNIGVVMPVPEKGRKMIGSSRTKELLAGAKHETEEDKKIMRGIMKPAYDFFVDTVMHKRFNKIKNEDTAEVFSGKIFVGRNAKDIGLADGLSDKRTLMKSAYIDGMEVVVVEYNLPPLLAIASSARK